MIRASCVGSMNQAGGRCSVSAEGHGKVARVWSLRRSVASAPAWEGACGAVATERSPPGRDGLMERGGAGRTGQGRAGRRAPGAPREPGRSGGPGSRPLRGGTGPPRRPGRRAGPRAIDGSWTAWMIQESRIGAMNRVGGRCSVSAEGHGKETRVRNLGRSGASIRAWEDACGAAATERSPPGRDRFTERSAGRRR